MKIIEQEEVRKLLQPKDCIQLMAEALKGLESGEYAQPARLITVMPNTAKFGFMPAYVGDYFGAKVIICTEYGNKISVSYRLCYAV